MRFDTNSAWLFGLWLGDRSSYGGISICNKDLPTIKKAVNVIDGMGIEDIKSKIYHNSKFGNLEETERFLKSLGIRDVSFYQSESCGTDCIYIYNNDKTVKPIFVSMRNNVAEILKLKPKLLCSILAGIFDAEGSIECTYRYATIEFKTGSIESGLIKLLLKKLGLEHTITIKNNSMTAFKIGTTLKDKRYLKKFYLNTRQFLSNKSKLEDLETIASGNYVIRNHQVLYPLFVKLNPGCSRSDMTKAFGRKGREGTRVRIDALLKNNYIRFNRIGNEYRYFITTKGEEFIESNRKLMDEIIEACHKNNSWGKGPIYKLSPFIKQLHF